VAGSIDFFNLAISAVDGVFAQTTAPSFLTTFVTQLWLWTRVAFGIGFVIFVHELGHFLAAKWCGVKVEKFYVGFDVPIKIGPIQFPRTLGRFRYGETEYGIGTIPLGGYVKMLGQDDDPRKAEAEAKRIKRPANSEDPEDEADHVTLDPRSFPAKPVWQRMIIISAGVVMNLITGVMFAMIAFSQGVPYTPAVVGDVTPGGPAYQAGIEPGGKVVSVGGMPRDERLHFREMKLAILTEGLDDPNKEVDIAIEYPNGEIKYQLASVGMPDDPSMRMIGISMPASTKLDKTSFAMPGSIASTVLTAADGGAQVIAFAGTPLPGDGSDDSVEGSIALRKYLQENVTKPVTLTLRRTDASEVDVTFPTQSLKLPGIRFAVGPVKALVKDGAASQAGVQVGDVLVAVDGNKSFDAFSLPSLVADVSKPTTLTLRRGVDKDAKDVELTITPSKGARSTSPISETDNIIALDRFEFAYEALAKVASVDYSVAGSAASDSPLVAGDELRSFAVRWPDGKVPASLAGENFEELRKKLVEGWEFSTQYPLTAFVRVIQSLPEGTEFKVLAARNEKIFESTSKVTLTDISWSERGIGFTGVERMHYASSVGEALSLGIRESKRRLGDVFTFLTLLVQGKVQSKQVGGPITIFRAAGAETTRGMSALLMFLTLLSMNLAILNFLPIPALDGGHMVFLVAEAVLGRPVNEKLQMQLTMAGVLALLSLMVFAVFNDIQQFR